MIIYSANFEAFIRQIYKKLPSSKTFSRSSLPYSVFVVKTVLFAAVGLNVSHMLKFIDLRKTPSLELGLMLLFAYTPYGLAEGLQLSGIMAILFAGIKCKNYMYMCSALEFSEHAIFVSQSIMFIYLSKFVHLFQ